MSEDEGYAPAAQMLICFIFPASVQKNADSDDRRQEEVTASAAHGAKQRQNRELTHICIMAKKMNTKTVRVRNDRFSTSRPELTLIRVGHYLWAMYKRSCGISGNVSERQALYAALETVWERKRELRAELSAQRAVRSLELRETFGCSNQQSSARVYNEGIYAAS